MCMCERERERKIKKDKTLASNDTGVNGFLMELFASQDHGQFHIEVPAKLKSRA